MQRLQLDGNTLSIEELVAVARQRAAVALDVGAKEAVRRGRGVLERVLEERSVVYGVNTGVGELGKISVLPADIERLQVNLIRSHACGVGSTLPVDVTRSMMLLRANTLAKGVSGVRLETLETLVEMLNRNVHPLVPAKGSVGASGDLAPLSHAALVLIGEGHAEYEGEMLDGATAMLRAGLRPVRLTAKEGIALHNGTEFMTALGALAVHDSARLLDTAVVTAALTLEALDGITDSFDPRVHRVRPHPGAIAVADMVRRATAGSTLLRASDSIRPEEPRGPQDPYSLRSIPPVLGAAKDLLRFVRSVVEIEMNSATDDPLFFDEGSGAMLYCCNFHGQPIAAALDVLKIACATIGNVAERRIALLTDQHHNRGLPAFLVHPEAQRGANSGFMIPQITAAALVSENKLLAHPASVDSIPTCANFEDFVSMGPIAGRHALEIIENAQQVVGVELLCAAQAIDIRGVADRLGKGTAAAYKALRDRVPVMKEDRVLAPDLRVAATVVREGLVLPDAVRVTGEMIM